MRRRVACLLVSFCIAFVHHVHAQSASVTGVVRDQAGGVLPGVDVRVREGDREIAATTTDASGRYSVPGVPPGRAQVVFTMPNFGGLRRDVEVTADGVVTADAVLRYVLSADVTVTERGMFTNLADVADPAQNLVGIAQAASQGAVTATQLEARPLSRAGEVLETVPGVIVSQHSGEGKANQYYLRGFNLDHGTDFATTVASIPVNMPTHAHGHGYSDLNFLIPELVGGVQYSKGPYYAEQGDFATAGAANITYVSRLEAPLLSVTGGEYGFGRVLGATSATRGSSTTLGAVELEHNDGPWLRPDAFRKINLAGRFTRGDAVSGLSLTALVYAARWNSTDQIPERAVRAGALDRYGNLDASDGGSTARASISLEWQRTTARSITRLAAYGLAYRLSLFSNFTYFLDDPVNGDQFRQADRRVVGGGRVTNRRILHWNGRAVQQTFGIQTRTDAIGLALDHTQGRALLENVRDDDVLQSSVGAFSETSVAWAPWLRASGGLRVDGYRFDVQAKSEPLNGGVARAGILSPKGGVVIGPFAGTEFYANAGRGFHSNDARGATITVDPASGEPTPRVTPLAPATGAELGVRTVAIPHLQTSVAVWGLGLASELIFIGDAGTTEAGRASRRSGVEIANYYHPLPWLTLDADLAWSRARFTDEDPAGTRIPGSVRTVAAAGVTIDRQRGIYGSARLRYFGPRPLVEDGSVLSTRTTLMNVELGYRWSPRLRFSVDGLNLLDAKDSDIDYFYASRLAGEPASGVADRHCHPALPRTFRATLRVGL
ncbi:MAG: TonB-dependent receptor [Vicinamibacterales bacterium]